MNEPQYIDSRDSERGDLRLQFSDHAWTNEHIGDDHIGDDHIGD